jgi:hypothetical protein
MSWRVCELCVRRPKRKRYAALLDGLEAGGSEILLKFRQVELKGPRTPRPRHEFRLQHGLVTVARAPAWVTAWCDPDRPVVLGPPVRAPRGLGRLTAHFLPLGPPGRLG